MRRNGSRTLTGHPQKVWRNRDGRGWMLRHRDLVATSISPACVVGLGDRETFPVAVCHYFGWGPMRRFFIYPSLENNFLPQTMEGSPWCLTGFLSRSGHPNPCLTHCTDTQLLTFISSPLIFLNTLSSPIYPGSSPLLPPCFPPLPSPSLHQLLNTPSLQGVGWRGGALLKGKNWLLMKVRPHHPRSASLRKVPPFYQEKIEAGQHVQLCVQVHTAKRLPSQVP